jgi:competence protein ComGC
MNEQALQLLYNEMSAQYDVGTFEDFKEYLSDDDQRSAFFEEAIKPNYDVSSLDEFDNTYGLKKKEDFISNDPESESKLDKDFSGIPIFKFISDAVGRGVAQGNTADEALGLIMSGNSATEEEIKQYIDAVSKMDSYAPSKSMQSFQKQYIEEGSDVPAFLSALWNNLEIAPEILLQSFAGMATAATTDEGAMAATAGLTAGAAAGAPIFGVGAIAGGLVGGMAAANGALETATSLTEFIKEKLDEDKRDFNAENVRDILSDEDIFDDIRIKALTRGGLISVIDLMGSGVAGKAVKGVSEVSKMGARATKLAQVGTGVAIESATGAIGEATAMAATGQEMDVAEIGLEAIGGLTTAPLSIGGAMSKSSYKIAGQEVGRKTAMKIVEKNPEILQDKSFELKNVPEEDRVKIESEQKKQRVKKDLPDGIPAENVDKVIEKEIEAEDLKNKESISAKKRLKEIEQEIEDLRKVEEKEEVVAEPEAFETKRVKITEPFTFGQTQVTFNEDGSVNEILNKRTGNPVTAATKRKVEKKILQDVIDVDAGKKAPQVEGITEGEVATYISENSENVREVAESIKVEKQRIKDAEQRADKIKTQDRGKESLAGETFTRESWESVTRNAPSENISSYWIRSKEKGGKNIEDGAQGFEADEIVKFILDYPNAEALKVLRGEPLDRNDLIDLQNKFKTLTGIDATDSSINTVLNIEEGRTPVEVLKMQEQEQLTLQAQEPGVFGKKRGPSAKKIVSEPMKEEVTVNVYDALKNQIRLEARAAREKKYSMDQARVNLSEKLQSLQKEGSITTKQASALFKKASKLNLDNPITTGKFLAYAEKVFDNAENAKKLSDAGRLKSSIRKVKKKEIEATVKGAVKDFLKIDPNLVENIDEYLGIANNVAKGLRATRVVKGDLKLSSDVSLKNLSEYISKELAKQTAIREQSFLDKYKEVLGDDVEGMSYQDMKRAVESLTEEEDGIGVQTENKDLIKSAFQEISESVKEISEFGKGAPDADDIYDVTDVQKSLIKRFTDMNLDLLTTKESIQALDALKNFLENGTTGGMLKIMSQFEGRSAARKLLGEGFSGYSIGKVGRLWGQFIASLNILSEYTFRGQKNQLKFFQESGLQDTITGNSEALKSYDDLQNEFSREFQKSKANGEKFTSTYNIVERGMIAFAVRNLQGTVQEQINEFTRRKDLIKQSIDFLQKQGGELKKRGDAYQKAYNKIIENSVNADEVISKADSINSDAVKWFMDKWSEIYPRLSDVSLNVYNKLLTKDVRYTPDFYAFSEAKDVDADLLTPAFEENLSNVVYDKESRTLKETVRPRTLGSQRASYVDLNFDRANLNAYKNALVDVNTAESISRLNGFLNDPSKAFDSIIQDDQTRQIIKQRILGYIRNIKSGNRPSSQDMKEYQKYIEKFATFSVAKALGGPTQYLKQLVPIVNTLINAGDLSVNAFMKKGAVEFILNSGYGIATRGFASLADFQNLRDSVAEIDKPTNKVISLLDSASKKMLKVFVQDPDRIAAQISWLTYYNKNLMNQGFSAKAIENIDWETHAINKEAADYAQQQVDRQQNVSDVALQGEFFSSRNIGASLARKIIAPFMNFAFNQKSRMYSDFIQLSSKYTTEEDRVKAGRSLMGLAVETAAFNYLGYGISMLLYAATTSILGKDEDPEDQVKRVKGIISGRMTNIASDVFSPFPKVTDPLIMPQINKILVAIQGGDEKEAFKLFAKDESSFADQIGLFGIAKKNAGDLFEILEIATTGSYKDRYGRTIELNREAQQIAAQTFLPKFLYLMGAAPVEVGTMSNYSVKELKKLKKRKSNSGSKFKRTYKY